MISLNYRDSRPIYEQIRDGLRKLIVTGALSADEKLPSVRALAAQLAINPNTIQRAYMTLEQEGLIYPVKGKGNFVADTSSIQKKSRQDYCREFQGLVRKGRKLGISEKTLTDLVQKEFEEEKND